MSEPDPARADRRWGIEHVQYTAMAYGAERLEWTEHGLRLSVFVLFGLVWALSAVGLSRLQTVYLAAARTELLSEDDRSIVLGNRLTNLALVGVLSLGVYFSFAALTAIGPFLEAERLAKDGMMAPIQEQMGNIAAEWETTSFGDGGGTADELKALEDALGTYAKLREGTLRDVVAPAGELFTDFGTDYDTQWLRVEAVTDGIQAIRRPDRGWRDATKVAAAELGQAWTEANALREAVIALASPTDAAGADARTLAGDQVRACLGASTALLRRAQEFRSLSTAPRDADDPRAVLRDKLGAALRTHAEAQSVYCLSMRGLIENFDRTDVTVDAEIGELVYGLALRRSALARISSEQQRLERAFRFVGRRARSELATSMNEYSAVRRAGPEWLDRSSQLAAWYERSFSEANRTAQECSDKLEVARETNLRQVSTALSVLSGARARSGRRTTENSLEDFKDAVVLKPADPPVCASVAFEQPELPSRSSSRASYGMAMGLISGWLLRSSTLDVVMVVGMLGFGLLGAGLSRIVRRQLKDAVGPPTVRRWMPRTPEHLPIVDDVPSILFQGLGATLVVFLAGVGGIGALSASNPTLDPYVVMLGCFTASVFSEDVWKSAQEWMQKGTKPGGSEAGPAAPPDVASVAAPATQEVPAVPDVPAALEVPATHEVPVADEGLYTSEHPESDHSDAGMPNPESAPDPPDLA